jgi:hypothetical protein
MAAVRGSTAASSAITDDPITTNNNNRTAIFPTLNFLKLEYIVLSSQNYIEILGSS